MKKKGRGIGKVYQHTKFHVIWSKNESVTPRKRFRQKEENEKNEKKSKNSIFAHSVAWREYKNGNLK